MFKVGFAGGLYYEGPVCDESGRVSEWHSPSAEWRYGNGGTVEWEWVYGRIGMEVWKTGNGCMGNWEWVYGEWEQRYGNWEWMYGRMGIEVWKN